MLNAELFVLVFIALTKSIIKGATFFMRGFELKAVFYFVLPHFPVKSFEWSAA